MLPQRKKCRTDVQIQPYLIDMATGGTRGNSKGLNGRSMTDLIESPGSPHSPIAPVPSQDSSRTLPDLPTNEFGVDHGIIYHLYELFYPFTNFQSLIFSVMEPYYATDYRVDKKSPFLFVNNNREDDLYDDTNSTNCGNSNSPMDWSNVESVDRVKELITKLLSTANRKEGIRELDLYLMFTSPAPNEIISELRFGSLSTLCDVHIDRFGRRTYHYRKHPHHRRERSLYFYNHSGAESHLSIGSVDMVGLADFIEEDTVSEISSTEIHYYDSDTVLSRSSNGGISSYQLCSFEYFEMINSVVHLFG